MTKVKSNSRTAKTAILKPTLLSLAVAQSLALHTAQAATITATCAIDSTCAFNFPGPGDHLCSLREAITSMNNGALEPGCTNTGDAFGTNDLVTTRVAYSFPLFSELSITTDVPLTIDLVGSTLAGAGTHRIFNISDSPNLTLSNMTITGGSTSGQGGGIQLQNSQLTLNNSTVENNRALAAGGGIANYNATLILNNSTVSGNAGSTGGGVYSGSRTGASLSIINSTITENTAATNGGGISQFRGSAFMSNATISGNTAGLYGGGHYLLDSAVAVVEHSTFNDNTAALGASFVNAGTGITVSLTLRNSILNSSGSINECAQIGSHQLSFVEDGGNWLQDASCTGVANGDPQLRPLADNGGPTQTHVPTLFSPVRNLVTANCSANDQRGYSRGALQCDAGAAEFTYAEIIVDSPADDNGAGCTLREALISTSSATLQTTGCAASRPLDIAEGRSIVFDPALAGETITLNGESLSISPGDVVAINPTTVSGLTISGGGQVPVLGIYNATVLIDTLSIENGNNQGSTSNFGGLEVRGNRAELVIQDSTFSSNRASTAGLSVYFYASATVINSTFTENEGAFVVNNYYAFLDVINSTIAKNVVTGATLDTLGYGAGITNLSNSIITSSNPAVEACQISQGGTVNHDSVTIISGRSTCPGGTRNEDPGLLDLADNGGPTKTMALSENSIARRTGILNSVAPFASCPLTDQRGNNRRQEDGACDVGAFEFLNSDVPINFFIIPLKNGGTVTIPL